MKHVMVIACLAAIAAAVVEDARPVDEVTGRKLEPSNDQAADEYRHFHASDWRYPHHRRRRRFDQAVDEEDADGDTVHDLQPSDDQATEEYRSRWGFYWHPYYYYGRYFIDRQPVAMEHSSTEEAAADDRQEDDDEVSSASDMDIVVSRYRVYWRPYRRFP